MVNLELKEYLLALVFIVFGILVIVVTNLFEVLVGIAFIVFGVLQLIPRKSKK